ncbi:hypothetical protein SLS55_006836 [Diplodia seriata]|uniref:DUF7580 domain-containing protein n=1 Tax=Diplodia seriata TaxID=420778 RepID=A0ABR3CAM1_9PEZI
MSGIEVAGLVLGAFPLLICAIDSTKQVSKLAGTWRNVRKEYRKCINDLRVQHAFYQLNLKELLVPLIPDDEESLLSELLAQPGCAVWKRPDLIKRLDKRLPSIRDEYLETMVALNDALEDLGEELGFTKKRFQDILLLETSISDRKDMVKAHVQHEYLKLKFSLSQSTREELLSTVSRYNRQLQDLLNRCDAVSALESARQKSTDRNKVDPKLCEFHQHADGLYTLLSKAVVCKCKVKHSVQLLLRHRKPIDYDFNMLFIFGGTPSSSPPWTSRETQIKIVHQEQPEQSHNEPVDGGSKSGLNILGRAKKRKTQSCLLKKYDNLADFGTKANAFTGRNTLNARIQHPNRKGTQGTAEIKDLCNSMSSLNPTCFGVLKDDQHHFAIYPKLQPPCSTDQREMVPLRSLIDGSLGVQLTRKQRFYIALTLSSSYLQLHSTQWLTGNTWTTSDILFPRQSGGDSNAISVIEPYISKHLADTSPHELISSRPGPSFALLGIMLLELVFNETLDAHDREKRYVAPDGKRNVFLNLAAALEWAEEEAADDAGPEFADAVKWCLGKTTTARRGTDAADDGNWRRELLVKVLEPLQMCYNVFDKSSRF